MKAFRAPGRVNLMGDHTDYNDGFVLPMAIDLECVVTARPAVRIRVRSRGDEVEVHDDGAVSGPAWGRLVAAVAKAIGATAAIDADVESTVPEGAGLSSSAAFEVALALALADASGREVEPVELALACQRAEQAATGVPSGIMDQLAAVCGRAGHALLIDCRSLDVLPVRLPDDLAVVVVHSGLPRELAQTEYAARRAECERDAAELGVASLRDAVADQARDRPRARHVVSENRRTLEMAEALRRDDHTELGKLMNESHASLRDDFEVSTPELDTLAASLVAAGALGARLTGAGFGGCVVALADSEAAPGVARCGAATYEHETGHQPRTWLPAAAEGAGLVP